MHNKKLPAAISLDLDNQWSYMKIHGDDGWQSFPSYLDIFVPYVINILKELNLKITFFIVGQDACLDKNKNALLQIPENGHECGNHSFNHESWIHKYSNEKMEREIEQAEEAILGLTDEKPVGFRGPGFSWSDTLIKVLHKKNYLYDASTLPTYIGPFARFYYFRSSHFTKEEKRDRKDLFGNFSDGLRKVKPYYLLLNNDQKLLEIPVSTIPVIKIPFHLSYLLYLSGISKKIMNAYLKTAINMCKVTGTYPSFLLHPLDLIGGDEISELKFFPGMNIKSSRKKEIFSEVIEVLSNNFELMNMKKFAQLLINSNELKSVKI